MSIIAVLDIMAVRFFFFFFSLSWIAVCFIAFLSISLKVQKKAYNNKMTGQESTRFHGQEGTLFKGKGLDFHLNLIRIVKVWTAISWKWNTGFTNLYRPLTCWKLELRRQTVTWSSWTWSPEHRDIKDGVSFLFFSFSERCWICSD